MSYYIISGWYLVILSIFIIFIVSCVVNSMFFKPFCLMLYVLLLNNIIYSFIKTIERGYKVQESIIHRHQVLLMFGKWKSDMQRNCFPDSFHPGWMSDTDPGCYKIISAMWAVSGSIFWSTTLIRINKNIWTTTDGINTY